MSARVIVGAEDIDVFYGTSQILFGVSLEVAEGQTMALLGRNGAGKSTTLKALAGIAPPARGVVRVLGKEMQGRKPHTIARAGIGFRGPELDGGAEIDAAGDVGTGLPAHEIGEAARQLAFVRRGKTAEQEIGHHEPEHVVTEKLETLIASDPVLSAERREMGQCAIEERGVGEVMADLLFEIAPARCRPAGHLTIVNSRFQRTAHGQVQTCHAGSPSPIEKKMICARPTRFSNGT